MRCSVSTPTVTNSTFSGNSSGAGGGIFNSSSSPTVTNCILWDDVPNEVGGSGIIRVTYSDVEGGWPGLGNINADPFFVDAANGDVRLAPGSPCIDAGDNTGVPTDAFDLDGDGNVSERIPLDLDGNPRFVDDAATVDSGNGVGCIVDMGAYEFPGACTEASDCTDCGVCTLDAFECSVCTWDQCEGGLCTFTQNEYGDVDHNGTIDIFDLLCILGCFAGDFSVCSFEDCDIQPCAGNGTINIFDLLAVLGAFAGNDPCCGGLP